MAEEVPEEAVVDSAPEAAEDSKLSQRNLSSASACPRQLFFDVTASIILFQFVAFRLFREMKCWVGRLSFHSLRFNLKSCRLC